MTLLELSRVRKIGAHSLAAIAALAPLSMHAGCAGVHTRPAWELPPATVAVGPIIPRERFHRTEFANGLHVMLLEDHRLPRVSLGLTTRRGAGSVDPAHAGLAAFTAELMKRGAGKRDAVALARVVDAIGAKLTVEAGWDSITISISGLSRDLDRLLELLGDVALRPRLRPGEANKASAQQLAALAKAKDDPATLVGWHAARVLYPGHRYGRPLDGTPETVSALTAAMARDFHHRVFVPNDAVLFASGDLSHTDWMRRAQAVFGATSWSRGVVPPPGPPPPDRTPAGRRVVVVDRPDLRQARIIISHEGIARADPRRVPASLMNNVLGGSGFSSRLMTSVRAEAGLTYGVYSGFSMRHHPGPFRVATFTRVAETRRVIDLLLTGLRDMRLDPPSERELLEIKSLAVGRFGLGLETSEALMASMVDLDVHGLPIDLLDTYRERVRAVDTGDTATVARDLLSPDRCAIVVLGPAAALAPQMQSLGAVEVVQP